MNMHTLRICAFYIAIASFLVPTFIAESQDPPQSDLITFNQDTQIHATPGTNLEKQVYECTAYDLSYESCEKYESDPGYGVTCSGISLAGLSREEAMAIAVDPRRIPLGSSVLLVFHEERMQKYNGIYKAVDVGGAIQDRRIDVFIPNNDEAMDFGRRTADVYIL